MLGNTKQVLWEGKVVGLTFRDLGEFTAVPSSFLGAFWLVGELCSGGAGPIWVGTEPIPSSWPPPPTHTQVFPLGHFSPEQAGLSGVAAALALSSPGEEGKMGPEGGGVWRKAVDRPLPVLAQGNVRSLA